MLGAGYAFISAYLKGEEAKIVTSSHIDRMSKASSIQDILGVIRDTEIGSYLEGTSITTFGDVDEYLWKYFGGCLERLEGFKTLPADIVKLLKAYITKYDLLNIKAALQGISSGRKTQSIPIGTIHDYRLLDELFTAGDVDSIIELLNKCGLGSYASILEEYKTDEGVSSTLLAEAKLDGEYYKNLLNITRNVKDGFVLAQAFGVIVDLMNLQIASRVITEGIGPEVAECTINDGYMLPGKAIRELLSLKLTDLPSRLENTQYHDVAEEVVTNYEKNKNVTVIEEIIDNHKFRLSKELLSPRVLSPLVVIWYLIIKETEIRNLRLILKATFDNIPLEEIKTHLVLSS